MIFEGVSGVFEVVVGVLNGRTGGQVGGGTGA